MNHKYFMRTLIFTTVFFLLCGISAFALAEGPVFWISPDGNLTVDAITVSKNEGKGYTLYLPGYMQTDDMKFGIAEGVSLTWGGKQVHYGDSAGIIRTGNVKIKNGKKELSVTVMRGSSGLPAVFVTSESGSLKKIEANKNNKEAGKLVLRGPEGDMQYDGALEHIKCRGNSSMTFVKKNYQIKLESGTDLLGMGKAKKWILTGNYRDRSFLRNQITLDLAAAVGLVYTPDHMPAELYINHEYRGLYLFSEKVEIGKNRLSIRDLEKDTKEINEIPLEEYKSTGKYSSSPRAFKAFEIPNDPEDITGGYLIEYESYKTRYTQEASAYTTKFGNILVVKSPEYTSVAQMKYISGLFQSFENAIMSEDGKDPDSGKHYSEIADMESLALKYMIEEISENYDGNSSSQYFYKPADNENEKIFAGPAWDYDSAYGSYAAKHNARNVLNPRKLWIANGSKTGWYPSLYRHKDFKSLVAELWNGRMKEAVEVLLGLRDSGTKGLKSIDDWQESIRDSMAMDRQRWSRPAKMNSVAQTGNTFDENIEFLKDYLKQRYEFLNKTWVCEE